jgi:hypothetical protein
VAEVKKDALPRFGITARQFNGVRFDLDQAVNGWRGTARYRVQNLKDAVEATVERIPVLGRQMDKARTEKRRASLRFKQVGKKFRLDRLKGRLSVVEAELAAGKPRVCFGGRDLLGQAEADASAIWRWRARREGRFMLVGAACEAEGNQTCRWDGRRLRLPDALGGKVVTLDGVTFRYGQAEMLAVLERNRSRKTRTALTWLLFRDDRGRWNVRVTVDEPVAKVVTDIGNGVLAVDLDADHVAAVPRGRDGRRQGRGGHRRHGAGAVSPGAEARLRHRGGVPGLRAQEGGPARGRQGERATAVGLRLFEAPRDPVGALRARRGRVRGGGSGVHERDRPGEVRPLPGHVAAPRGGAGHRPRGDGLRRTPRPSGRHRPRRTWKDAPEERAAPLAGRSKAGAGGGEGPRSHCPVGYGNGAEGWAATSCPGRGGAGSHPLPHRPWENRTRPGSSRGRRCPGDSGHGQLRLIRLL